tara:strand:- start:2550 stop:2786 length:237 start_codon:yes stop_codon:yes gene_type:complete
MTEKVKTEGTAEDKLLSAAVEITDLNQKLKYAQKLITNLQTRLNESNGVGIQLEAKLQLAEEDYNEAMKKLEGSEFQM